MSSTVDTGSGNYEVSDFDEREMMALSDIYTASYVDSGEFSPQYHGDLCVYPEDSFSALVTLS